MTYGRGMSCLVRSSKVDLETFHYRERDVESTVESLDLQGSRDVIRP